MLPFLRDLELEISIFEVEDLKIFFGSVLWGSSGMDS